MKISPRARTLLAPGLLVVASCIPQVRAPSPSAWTSLFDGRSLAGWHGWRSATPAGWAVVDGAITRVGKGSDLVTDSQYANFEIALDWKVEPGGAGGIVYRVNDAGAETYETGPGMQVLDEERRPDGQSPLAAAGSDFGLYPAPRGIVKEAGEWNAARILVKGSHVEHWLNGTKVVEYELGSPEWKKKVAASRFRAWKGYGLSPRGRIALQNRGHKVQFRNIRIRVLPAPSPAR